MELKRKLMGVQIEAKDINLSKSVNMNDKEKNKIGELRSACYSPHFKKVIGIAMINKPFFEVSQTFEIVIDKNTFIGKVCNLPFI